MWFNQYFLTKINYIHLKYSVSRSPSVYMLIVSMGNHIYIYMNKLFFVVARLFLVERTYKQTTLKKNIYIYPRNMWIKNTRKEKKRNWLLVSIPFMH
jgi:membrane associated rhomboid family serine protease